MAEKMSIVDSAIIEGVESIIKEHPRFIDFEEYFLKHIDKKKIRENLHIICSDNVSKLLELK